MANWTFLSHHAQVMLCIAHDPAMRLRDIGDLVGITERAAHRIVAELVDAGYLQRERVGRRNRYTISTQMRLPDEIARNQRIGDLLALLTASPAPSFGQATLRR
jgi:DNA-binding MarR family transcriptional regulator